MRIILLKEIPEDADLRRDWNALVLRVEQPQVFYTYEWALAAYRAYGSSLRALLFLGYDEAGDLSGVAALASDSSGRRASFLCATTGDYCDFICPSPEKERFIRAVLSELRKSNIAEIAMANLPADSGTASIIKRISSRNQYHCFSRTGYVCSQVVLSLLERRQGTDKPVLPRKKMLRRFLSAMSRENPVRLDHERSWETIQSVLPEFMQAHIARFLATGRISNMAHRERQQFLAELAELLSASGCVVLTRMMSGDRAFAWNYGFQYQGTWFWYQPTFDSELEKYSPGFCLLAKLIEEASENPGLKMVDMGLGSEEYKERFANRSREILYLTLHTRATRHYREMLRFHVSNAVRRFPKVESGIRNGLRLFGRAKALIDQDGVPALVSKVGARLMMRFLWLSSEVRFYEWCGSPHGGVNVGTLRPLDLNALASATCQYVDDPDTLSYLLRAASRLRERKADGYALVDSQGKFLHFAWATDFDGFFLSELNVKVNAPYSDCVMVYDCWTPVRERGCGHYGRVISLLAESLQEKGKHAWIFSASSNTASIRVLEKSRFEHRYSLTRQRLLGSQWIKGEVPNIVRAVIEEIPAIATKCG